MSWMLLASFISHPWHQDPWLQRSNILEDVIICICDIFEQELFWASVVILLPQMDIVFWNESRQGLVLKPDKHNDVLGQG